MRRFITWLLVFALLLSGLGINGGSAKAYTFGSSPSEEAKEIMMEELFGLISSGVTLSWDGGKHVYCFNDGGKIDLSKARSQYERAKKSYTRRVDKLNPSVSESKRPKFPESLAISVSGSTEVYKIHPSDIVDSNTEGTVNEELALEYGKTYTVYAQDCGKDGVDNNPQELFVITIVNTDLSVFSIDSSGVISNITDSDRVKDGVALLTNNDKLTYLFVWKSKLGCEIDTDVTDVTYSEDLSVTIGSDSVTIPKDTSNGSIKIGDFHYGYVLGTVEDASYLDFNINGADSTSDNVSDSGIVDEYKIIVDKTPPTVECFSFMENIYIKFSDETGLDEVKPSYTNSTTGIPTTYLDSGVQEDIVSGGECIYHEILKGISKSSTVTVTDLCGNKTSGAISDFGYSYDKGSKHAIRAGRPVADKNGEIIVESVAQTVPKVQAVSLNMYNSIMKAFTHLGDNTYYIAKGTKLENYDGNGNSKEYPNGAYFKPVGNTPTDGVYDSGSLWYVYEPKPVYGVESVTAYSYRNSGLDYMTREVGDKVEKKVDSDDSFLSLAYRDSKCDVYLCKKNVADFIDPASIGYGKEGYTFLPSVNMQAKKAKYYFAVNKLIAPSNLEFGKLNFKKEEKENYVIYYIDNVSSGSNTISYQTEYGYNSDYTFSFPLDDYIIEADALENGFYGEGYLSTGRLLIGDKLSVDNDNFIINTNSNVLGNYSVYQYYEVDNDKPVYDDDNEVASIDKWRYSLRDIGRTRQIMVKDYKGERPFEVYNSSLVPNAELYRGAVLVNENYNGSLLQKTNTFEVPKKVKGIEGDELIASLDLPLIATDRSNILIDSENYEDRVGNHISSSFGWHNIKFFNIEDKEDGEEVRDLIEYENVRLIPKDAFAWSNMYNIPVEKVLVEGEDAENEVNIGDYVILPDKNSEVASIIDMSTGLDSSLIGEEVGSLLKVDSSDKDAKVKVTLNDGSWRVFNVKKDSNTEGSGGEDNPSATPSPTPSIGDESDSDRTEVRRQYKIGEDGVKQNEVEVRVYDKDSVVYDDTEKESVIEEESGEYTSTKKTVILGDKVLEDQEYIRFEDFNTALTEEDGVLKHEYSILPFTTVKNATVYVNGKKVEDEGIVEELDPNDQSTELNANIIGRYVKVKGGKRDFDNNIQSEEHNIEIIGGLHDGDKKYFVTKKGTRNITSSFIDLKETRYMVDVLSIRIPFDCYYVKIDGKVANTTNKGDASGGSGNTGKGEITGTIGRPTSVTPDNIEDGKTYPGSLIIGGIPDDDRVFVDGNEVFDRPVIIGSGTHEIVIVHGGGTVDRWEVTVDPSGGNGTTITKPAEGTQNQGTTVNGIDNLIDGGKYPGDVTIIGIPDTWTVVVDGNVVTKRPVVVTGDGKHVITVIDSNGNSVTKEITIEQNSTGSIVVPADKIQDGQIFDNGSIIIQPVGGKDIILDANGSGGTTVGGVDNIIDGGTYTGNVTITDIPDGWNVTVDGKPAGSRPIVISGNGSHTIVVTDENGNTIIKNITIEEGSGGVKIDKDTEITAPGTHKVTITDEFGNKEEVIFTVVKNGGDYSTKTVFDFSYASRVWVDGKEVNLKFSIAEVGVHKIKVLYPDGTVAEFTVNIKSNTKKDEPKVDNPKQDIIVTPASVSGIFGVKNKKAYKKAITLRVLDKGNLGKATLKYKKTKKAKKWKTSTFTGSKVCKKQGMYKVIFGNQKVSFTIDRVTPSAKLKNKKSYKKGTKIKVSDNLSGVKKIKVGKKSVKVRKGKFTLAKKGKKIKVTIWDKAGNKKKYTVRVK